MEIAVDAVIDTGFDGYLCLPVQLAIQLGLELSGSIKVELADGSIKRELVFSGLTKFGEEAKKARITLTESMNALIGTKMFSHLGIDFDLKRVRIE
jgi:clan AA aspartic protease